MMPLPFRLGLLPIGGRAPLPRKGERRRRRLVLDRRYSGAALRAIRARNGVGRPPEERR